MTQVNDYEISEHRKRPPRQEKVDVRMPNVKGLGLREALKVLIEREIVAEVAGSGQVVSQIPAAGEIITGRVELLCSGTTVANNTDR